MLEQERQRKSQVNVVDYAVAKNTPTLYLSELLVKHEQRKELIRDLCVQLVYVRFDAYLLAIQTRLCQGVV